MGEKRVGSIKGQAVATCRACAGTARNSSSVAVPSCVRGLLGQGFVSLQRGVAEPQRYLDGAVHATLQALGCGSTRCDEGVRFTRRLLDA